ncbi:hypothetical protein HK097_005004 [Rhizophlyctis rosea]|uniref:Uncharacterized protein n=1 Tax=Rhizophlyctis rosea TaxID=64517 RepID=A0AAD5X6A6_9FUNG|nr:hypothetical protein HK097_005004 [Rhizophlyctis rosea]
MPSINFSNPTHQFLLICYFLDLILWTERFWRAATPTQQALNSKFSAVRTRKIIILLHILGGVLEIIMGAVAFFTMSPIAIYITLFCCLAIHTPTSIIMTPKVYGARRLMVPAYIACIALHVYCAIMTFKTFCGMWLTATIIVAHTYAFVRIFYVLLNWTNTTPGCEYTIAVLLAGAMTIPYVPTAQEYHLFFVAMLFIAIYASISSAVSYLKNGEIKPSEETPIPIANARLVRKRAAKREAEKRVSNYGTVVIETGLDNEVLVTPPVMGG